MLHSVTELKARPELEHARDPKQERPSLPIGSSPSGRGETSTEVPEYRVDHV